MGTFVKAFGRVDNGDGQFSIWSVAWVARTLVEMGPKVALSMSATQRIRGDEADEIRALLPMLAAQYGLRARMDEESGSVTVTFERRP